MSNLAYKISINKKGTVFINHCVNKKNLHALIQHEWPKSWACLHGSRILYMHKDLDSDSRKLVVRH